MEWGRRDEAGTSLRGRLSLPLPSRAWWRDRRRAEADQERARQRETERARWAEATITSARPLVRPAPRSAMFFPLVVIVAVLPGLYALNSWDLTPPGPWWGLRALVMLDGHAFDQLPAADEIAPPVESHAYRMIASQPPLYAWLGALGLTMSAEHNPIASVLPSYVAGAITVILVYLHGRLWRGPAVGLIAALLIGFNRHLLVQMQQATPSTLALAGALAALLCYGRHQCVTSETSGADSWDWDGPFVWPLLGGLALGLSLLAFGLFGLTVFPLVLLHRAYVHADTPLPRRDRERGAGWGAAWFEDPSLHAGLIVIGTAALVAGPWYYWMIRRHGFEVAASWMAPYDFVTGMRPTLLGRMVDLAPATLPLGLFGAIRSIRLALTDESRDRAIIGGVFWVLWLAVAALLPVAWPTGPWSLGGLFLLVPLNLLAAQTIADLADRRIPVRRLNWLAPATAVSVAWSISVDLRVAASNLTHGRTNSATALGLHLALDLVIAAVVLTRGLDRWARRRDDRQRRVLAGFLVAVLLITVATGSNEVRFRHSETGELLQLRAMILRRDRQQPFEAVAVIGPETSHAPAELSSGANVPTAAPPLIPGGRLRFILRTALPHLPQRDLTTTEDLARLPHGQHLVILAGSNQSLPYSEQVRYNLETIHPGHAGILDAFATSHDAPTVRR